MVDPTSTNVLLALPTRGSDPGTWDVPVNNNSLELDGFLGGVQVIAASSSPITLTAPTGIVTATTGPFQSTNAVLRVTGTLTSNVQITLPLPGYMIVENLTTGSFLLYFGAVGNTEIIAIEQGAVQHIYNDGSRVRFVNLPVVGSYLDICDATVPSWITACTKPPFLNCNGSTFNATTYPYLNVKLGGNTLPDFRGVSPAYLNQGTGRLQNGVNGNVNYSLGGTDTITLTVGTLPVFTPTLSSFSINIPAQGNWGFAGSPVSNAASFGANNATLSSFPTTSGTINMNSIGGNQAHINVQPTTVGGIRLIRAA